MTKVLNLSLKKDVFENLQNGTTNEVHIENTKWWKKRLMDLDTGRFKKFTTVTATSGSSDKVEYDIEKIELVENEFVITLIPKQTVDTGDSDIETPVETPEPVQEETPKEEYVQPEITVQEPEPVKEEETTEEVEEDIKEEVEIPPVKKTGPTIIKKETPDIKATVMAIFNKFCELKDVFVVNMSNVTIRNNGQIFGCNKRRLIADRDSDVKFNFIKKEFVKYSYTPDNNFTAQILNYLEGLLKNNYVFVNKNLSGFRTGDMDNLIFTVYAISKRKYLFIK